MPKYIDIEPVVSDLAGMREKYNAVTLDAMIKDLETRPLAELEPVRRGEWVNDTYSDEPITRCTNCKKGFSKDLRAERFPRCPKCGAHMRARYGEY